jgi:ActR/RegA family two-component response regulator
MLAAFSNAARPARAFTAKGGTEARAILRRHEIDLAVVDFFMPEESGDCVVRELRRMRPHLEIAMVTGNPDMEVGAAAIAAGADVCIEKPATLREILARLDERAKESLATDELSSLDGHEWRQIVRVLRACHGNKSRASRILGISRATLSEKLARGAPK